MSFGVFLCPESHSVKAAHTVEAVRTVWPINPSPASGQIPNFDQDQISCVGRAHRPTSPSTGLQERGLSISPVADLINMPDVLNDYSVNIPVDSYLPEHFCFCNSQGVSVGGPVYGISCDAVLSHGTARSWEACLDWEVVFEPPYDLADVRCDTTSMNAGSVTVTGGGLPVFSMLVGGIDGDKSLPEDIADLVYMVEWMFEGNPAPRYPLAADCNGDSLVVIADLAFRVGTTPLPD